MSKEPEAFSPSGAPIYKHEGSSPREFRAAAHHALHLEEIEAHLAKHIGKVDDVWHEVISEYVHLDVLQIRATAERPWHLLVTSGVSDEPMKVPQGAEEHRRVELLMALPPEWPLTQDAFKDEANYWPIRWLKLVGRLPHQYDTWIGWGHTVPNGDPPEPIADTKFTGVMLAPCYHLPKDFFRMRTAAGEPITFYQLLPLYPEEMDLKLEQGSDELEKRFEKQGIGFVLDVRRPNVALKRGWFRW
jgi:hypothetical protein